MTKYIYNPFQNLVIDESSQESRANAPISTLKQVPVKNNV
jgi:hypothetical protein